MADGFVFFGSESRQALMERAANNGQRLTRIRFLKMDLVEHGSVWTGNMGNMHGINSTP